MLERNNTAPGVFTSLWELGNKERVGCLIGIAEEEVLSILSLGQFAFVSHSYLEALEKQIISTNK